jgi:putative transposase
MVIQLLLEPICDDSARGSAYIYTRAGSSWSQQTKLIAADGASNDYFGRSVAISSDGNTAIIGAYNPVDARGSTYIYNGQVGYPKFRSRFKHNSIRLTSQVIKVDKDQLYLPKSKTPIHIRLSRPLPSPPSQVTITRTRAGHYYASFLCVFEPTTTSGTDIIGIDFGLTNLIVTSDGQIIQPPQFYRQLEHKLAKAQAKLSRTQPGSNNRYKARLQVAKISAKIANKRADFIHQLTSALIKRSATIVIENLNVAGMQQSNNLGKSITDASLAEIRRQLDYKAVFSQHTNLVIVSRYYASTKQCYVTGKRHNVKRGATEWYCPDCDKVHDRDQNAALNLAKVAHAPAMQARMLNQHGKIFKLFTSSEL